MLIWISFIVFILILIAIDLGVLNKEDHVPRTREALGYTLLWATIGLSFSFVVRYLFDNDIIESELSGGTAMLKYLTGYLVELSLSMDNVFVIALIFSYFQVPQKYQHRVLFWGILGALVFRAIMIFLGVFLLEKFEFMFYVFGVILLYSAWKMLDTSEDIHPSKNPVILWLKRIFPITKEYHGHNFFIRRRHILAATPLFVTLVMVETTDVVFAFDSIPAILGITTDPFLVFSSNVFAILGLRSLYFVLAAMINLFDYLRYSLAGILLFVAVKMLVHAYWAPPEWLSLVVIALLLGGGIVFSLARPAPAPAEPEPEAPAEPKSKAVKIPKEELDN
jgi:tellurite resistance protein TerC